MFVRLLGCAGAAVLGLWCVTIAIHSFTPQAGAGLPLLAGGVGMQALLGLAGLVTVSLLIVGASSLGRTASPGRPRTWLVVALAAWAGAAALATSAAHQLFLAPIDSQMGIGPGVAAVVAPEWAAFLWTVAAACGGLAALLVVRRALAPRERAALTPPAARPPGHGAAGAAPAAPR